MLTANPIKTEDKTLAALITQSSFLPFWKEATTKEQIAHCKKIREDLFEEAKGLISESKYSLALPTLEELSDLTPLNQTYREELCLAQIALGVYSEAELTMNQLTGPKKEKLRQLLETTSLTENTASKEVIEAIQSRIQLRKARQLYSVSLGWGNMSAFDPDKQSGMSFTIVTGLPRSGTSLMMQLLRCGGLDICADILGGDQSNPGGYLESRRMDKFIYDPVLLESMNRNAIKLFLDQIAYLPISHHYKIIFMQRPLDEVLKSQRKFILTHPDYEDYFNSSHMSPEAQNKRREELFEKLNKWPQVDLHCVNFPDLVENPTTRIDSLAAFLGINDNKRIQSMTELVDPQLYHDQSN